MFTLSEIKTDNAAFDDDGGAVEIARILRNIADRLDQGEREGAAVDANGNKVGEFCLEIEGEDEHCEECGLHEDDGHMPNCSKA
jgi:hypothetical protein